MDIKQMERDMEAALEKAKAAEGADAINAAMDEFDGLAEQVKAAKRFEEAEKAAVAEAAKAEPQVKQQEKPDAVKAFAAAARARFKGNMNETTGSAGGYTVPEDISTQIEHLREAEFSLRDLVTVQNVNTVSGARTFISRASHSGFSSVNEAGAIGAKAVPSFSRLTYSIVKYAGFFPVTNELLDDTDANIVGELTQWIAKEGRATDNTLILAALDAKYTRSSSPETEKTISGIDSIKNILNKDLGQAFKPTSCVVTNDTGLAWLDTLKDSDNRYLLAPNPADPMKMNLCAGATVVPLYIVPNAVLADDTTDGTPFYIGDLKEAITLFDRRQLSIASSDVASIGSGSDAVNAWSQDMTVFRAIMRLCCKCKDEQAYFKGFYSAE